MQLYHCKNYNEISRMAADIVITELNKRPKMLLCTASGSSPALTYQNLVEVNRQNPVLFEKMKVLKLDEWGGISMTNPESCEMFLQQNLIKPLGITNDRFISFHSDHKNPEQECHRVSTYLNENGPIDICVLGLGKNGHIAFNEPSAFMQPHCHVAELSEKSMTHPMAQNMGETPTYGITIGMADILQSRKIIMLVTGTGKKNIAEEFLKGIVTPFLPASFLWLHAEVYCFIDEEVLNYDMLVKILHNLTIENETKNNCED